MKKGNTKGAHKTKSSCGHSSKPKSECENNAIMKRTTSNQYPRHLQFADFFPFFL